MMTFADPPERRIVTLPYSEACMHLGIAGDLAVAIEEARYVNGMEIPKHARVGVTVQSGTTRAVITKSEAGWDL